MPGEWDDATAEDLIGALVLIGMTYLKPDGAIDRKEQLFGRVTQADPGIGFLVALEGRRTGESFRVPPSTAAFARARPGTYTLHATGEKVIDPDYTCTWTVNPPKQ